MEWVVPSSDLEAHRAQPRLVCSQTLGNAQRAGAAGCIMPTAFSSRTMPYGNRAVPHCGILRAQNSLADSRCLIDAC